MTRLGSFIVSVQTQQHREVKHSEECTQGEHGVGDWTVLLGMRIGTCATALSCDNDA